MKPNIKRIQKLSAHLRAGHLGHDKFDIGCFHAEVPDNPCQTQGCAIGEFPIIWPHMFQWSTFGVTLHTARGNGPEPDMQNIAGEFSIGGRWLGLCGVAMMKLFATRDLSSVVFLPRGLDPEFETQIKSILVSLPWHGLGATRNEVAESLDAFCRLWLEAGLPVTDTEEEDKL